MIRDILNTGFRAKALFDEVASGRYMGTNRLARYDNQNGVADETQPSENQLSNFLGNLPGYVASRAIERGKTAAIDALKDLLGDENILVQGAGYCAGLLDTVDDAVNGRVSYTEASQEDLKRLAGSESKAKTVFGYTTEKGQIYIDQRISSKSKEIKEMLRGLVGEEDADPGALLLLTEVHEKRHSINPGASEKRTRLETKYALKAYARINRDPEIAKKAEKAARLADYFDNLDGREDIGLQTSVQLKSAT